MGFGLMAYRINEVWHPSKIKETCIEVADKYPWSLPFIPDHLKTQEMCNKEVDIKPHFLVFVPDRSKTQEMCNKAVCKHPWFLKYVPGWFVIQQQIK